MSEKIRVQCTSCFATLAVPDSAAGKKIRCPKCQGVVSVPQGQPSAPDQFKPSSRDAVALIEPSWHTDNPYGADPSVDEYGEGDWGPHDPYGSSASMGKSGKADRNTDKSPSVPPPLRPTNSSKGDLPRKPPIPKNKEDRRALPDIPFPAKPTHRKLILVASLLLIVVMTGALTTTFIVLRSGGQPDKFGELMAKNAPENNQPVAPDGSRPAVESPAAAKAAEEARAAAEGAKAEEARVSTEAATAKAKEEARIAAEVKIKAEEALVAAEAEEAARKAEARMLAEADAAEGASVAAEVEKTLDDQASGAAIVSSARAAAEAKEAAEARIRAEADDAEEARMRAEGTGEPNIPAEEVTPEIVDAVKSVAALLQSLQKSNVFGAAAISDIETLTESQTSDIRKSTNFVVAISILKIDRGLDPRADLRRAAAKNPKHWVAWRSYTVSSLVFEGGKAAFKVLKRYQDNVLKMAEHTTDEEAQTLIGEIMWIQDSAERMASLPSVSDGNISELANNPQLIALLSRGESGVMMEEAQKNKEMHDKNVFEANKKNDEEKLVWIDEEIDRLTNALNQSWADAQQRYSKCEDELAPLRSELSAANGRLSAVRSALSSAESDYRAIKKEQTSAKASAQAAIRVLESQEGSAEADVSAAAGPYNQKISEMRDIRMAAACYINFVHNSLLLIRANFQKLLEASVPLNQKLKGLESAIVAQLAQMPPMPIVNTKKTRKTQELEETRRIAKELQVDLEKMFQQLMNL